MERRCQRMATYLLTRLVLESFDGGADAGIGTTLELLFQLFLSPVLLQTTRKFSIRRYAGFRQGHCLVRIGD